MKALILAAGYATRLYPLTKEFPKPLLVVEKRPIIDYIMDKIDVLDEVDEVIVVTNSKFFGQFKEWAASRAYKKPISLIDDLTKNNEDRLGAIGDIHFAVNSRKCKGDLLVVGGDNLFDGNLKDFVRFAKTHTQDPVIGVYNILDIANASKYGVVELNQGQQVVDFKEKPQEPKSSLVAMCLYYFPAAKLGLIQEYLDEKHDLRDATGFYIDWLHNKVPVYAFTFHGRWYDIGDHKFYSEASEKFK